jgi:ribonuclease VapC
VIVDSSALVAILRVEPQAERLVRAVVGAAQAFVPASCYLETCMVIAGHKGPDSRPKVDRLLAELRLGVLPVSARHARLAVDAFLRYGKGRHAAGLNVGDCMAYAVAQVEGAPLLFVGGDFAKTDTRVAGQ